VDGVRRASRAAMSCDELHLQGSVAVTFGESAWGKRVGWLDAAASGSPATMHVHVYSFNLIFYRTGSRSRKRPATGAFNCTGVFISPSRADQPQGERLVRLTWTRKRPNPMGLTILQTQIMQQSPFHCPSASSRRSTRSSCSTVTCVVRILLRHTLFGDSFHP
jgi:hypothetical protein